MEELERCRSLIRDQKNELRERDVYATQKRGQLEKHVRALHKRESLSWSIIDDFSDTVYMAGSEMSALAQEMGPGPESDRLRGIIRRMDERYKTARAQLREAERRIGTSDP